MTFDLEAALTGLAENPFAAHEALFKHEFPSAPFHKQMVDLYWSGVSRGAVQCFRGSAKSTRAEESIILQAVFKRFNYAVILGANEDRACDRLLKVKYQLETNSQLEALFGPARGDIWQATRIVLRNGVCIDAVGAGQSLRGMKYLDYRPQYAFVDDLEELSRYLDNVSTPEKREELSEWFYGSFLPALAEPNPRIRMAGTPLHEESLISRVSRLSDWNSIIIPIEYLSETGKRVPSWPGVFPLEKIDRMRTEYVEAGRLETFGQEFLCRSTSPEARSFRQSMFRYDEDRVRTWEPVYVIYDPARTVGPKSCATGKVAASWVGDRMLIWEATANFWQPDEIVNDVFDSDDKYLPIAVAFEETGLNQWAIQPLRSSQITRGHPVPLSSINPPKGKSKESFILGLQPLFAAGQIIFCGQRQSFDNLVKELLGYPYGLRDTINALAYMQMLKPGVPIYENFAQENVFDPLLVEAKGTPFLLLNSDTRSTAGILVRSKSGVVQVVADFLESGDPGNIVEGIAQSVRALIGGKPICYAGPQHFQQYDNIGLRAAARACGLNLLQGGALIQGREELRRLIQLIRGQTPMFRVSKDATWTLRALSGGYARMPDKKEVKEGGYKIVGEALETFCAVLAMGGMDNDQDLRYSVARDGRKFLSSMPEKGEDRPRRTKTGISNEHGNSGSS